MARQRDHFWLGHEGPGESHSLLLSATELGRQSIFEAAQLHEFEDVLYALLDLALRYSTNLEWVRHISKDSHVGGQIA